MRANYSFMAVKVPPGKSSIELNFIPEGFEIGAWISGLSVLLLIGFCIREKKKSIDPNFTRTKI